MINWIKDILGITKQEEDRQMESANATNMIKMLADANTKKIIHIKELERQIEQLESLIWPIPPEDMNFDNTLKQDFKALNDAIKNAHETNAKAEFNLFLMKHGIKGLE